MNKHSRSTVEAVEYISRSMRGVEAVWLGVVINKLKCLVIFL
jgi:hypothetical protein